MRLINILILNSNSESGAVVASLQISSNLDRWPVEDLHKGDIVINN